MVQNPSFFDEGQIADQRAYDPQMDGHQDGEDDGPNEARYSRAFEYLMQSREPPGRTQASLNGDAMEPQEPMQM